MRTRNPFHATVIIMITMTLVVTASAQKDGGRRVWSEYKAADQGFSISFPGTPETRNQPVESNKSAMQYFYTLDFGDHAYLVSVVYFGAGNGPDNPNQAYYKKLVDAYAGGSSSTVKSQHATTVAGHTAVEAVAYNSDASLWSLLNIVAASDRVYMIVSLGPKGHETSEEAYRFRDSFHLLRVSADHSADNHSKDDLDSALESDIHKHDHDSDHDSQWAEFRSAQQQFAALFPGTPSDKVSPPDDESSPTQHNFMIEIGPRVYMVSVLDFPAGKGPVNADDDYYIGLVNAYAKGSESKLRSHTFTTIAGRRGIEAITDSDSLDSTYVLDIIVRGDRLYMITSGGPKGHEKSTEAQKFRDSFRLLKRDE